MPVFFLNPDDLSENRYSVTDGEGLEERKRGVAGGWDNQPDFVQQAYLDKWAAEETTTQTVEATPENIAALTEFSKGLNARKTSTDEARQALVLELFKQPLAELKKEQYATKKNKTDRIDAIAAVQEAVGTSYDNIAGWLDETERVKKGTVYSVQKTGKVIAGYEDVSKELKSRKSS